MCFSVRYSNSGTTAWARMQPFPIHPSMWGGLHASLKVVAMLCVCEYIYTVNEFSVLFFAGGNQDGKFSVGFRDGIVRTVVGLDREAQAAYTLVVEAIGVSSVYTSV